MLIAQISDTHFAADAEEGAEANRARLDRVLGVLGQLHPRPDLLLVTGDLSADGSIESYRRLRAALEGCPIPAWPCIGNHDNRGNFRTVFGDVPTIDGFVQYGVEAGPIQVLVLDTVEDGRHGGGFCEKRAAWLAERLAEQPQRPTLIAMHHPPFDTGIDWLTTRAHEPWVARLAEAVEGQGQIIGMVCGHIHRPMMARWSGQPVTVCPATAPQVALTLAPVEAELPDHRPMTLADAPGYALHLWKGGTLVTHHDTADAHVVLTRFDRRQQPLVRSLIGELPSR